MSTLIDARRRRVARGCTVVLRVPPSLESRESIWTDPVTRCARVMNHPESGDQARPLPGSNDALSTWRTARRRASSAGALTWQARPHATSERGQAPRDRSGIRGRPRPPARVLSLTPLLFLFRLNPSSQRQRLLARRGRAHGHGRSHCRYPEVTGAVPCRATASQGAGGRQAERPAHPARSRCTRQGTTRLARSRSVAQPERPPRGHRARVSSAQCTASIGIREGRREDRRTGRADHACVETPIFVPSCTWIWITRCVACW
jgi:hypothetical protein